jgi:hypothetical protein
LFISHHIAIVKSADHVAHRKPAEKPGPLARRAILPHGEAQRCHVEKGPPPGGESVPNPQRIHILPDQHLSFR